jgi:hypothetical protein
VVCPLLFPVVRFCSKIIGGAELPRRQKETRMQNIAYKAYSLSSFRDIPQMAEVPETLKFDIEVVGHVLPFKTNNFVVDHLIDWGNIPDDPLFVLNFPQRGMETSA